MQKLNELQAVFDIYHPHTCLFLYMLQTFFSFTSSIYKFMGLGTCFRTWDKNIIDTYRGIRKMRVIYSEDYLYYKLTSATLTSMGSNQCTLHSQWESRNVRMGALAASEPRTRDRISPAGGKKWGEDGAGTGKRGPNVHLLK